MQPVSCSEVCTFSFARCTYSTSHQPQRIWVLSCWRSKTSWGLRIYSPKLFVGSIFADLPPSLPVIYFPLKKKTGKEGESLHQPRRSSRRISNPTDVKHQVAGRPFALSGCEKGRSPRPFLGVPLPSYHRACLSRTDRSKKCTAL